MSNKKITIYRTTADLVTSLYFMETGGQLFPSFYTIQELHRLYPNMTHMTLSNENSGGERLTRYTKVIINIGEQKPGYSCIARYTIEEVSLDEYYKAKGLE